jgi:iron complex transport system permease protein
MGAANRHSPTTARRSAFSVPEHRRFKALLVALSVLLLASITFSVTLGPVEISPATVWKIAIAQTARAVGVETPLFQPDWTNAEHNIVWLIRLPRVLLAGLVGAGLAVVGVTLQAMVRNPLADPYILGVSSGASVGAVLVLGWGVLAFAGVYALSLGAFLGALLSCVVVFMLAHSNGRLLAARLILSGVAVGYFFAGVTSLITLTSDQRELARSVLSWMLGNLAGTEWSMLGLPALALAVGTVYLILQARPLNALIVGEETATTLGVDPTRLRRVLFLVVSLLTGTVVAVSGAIGFVGLMIPHVARLVVGADHRRVLPVALLIGAIFLIGVDAIARTAFAPVEVPVGVITALIGGPFFIWLLHRQLARPGYGG